MLAHITVSPIVGVAPVTVVAVFVFAGIGLVLAIIVADRVGLLDRSAVPFRRWTGLIAAGFSIGAAAIHAAVIDVHVDEYPPFGVAFAGLALFQAGWAVAFVISPRRPVAVAGVVVNIGALAVWAVSRTIGLPVGPDPGLPEPVGSLDLATVALETALVTVVVWSSRGASFRAWRPALTAQRAAIVLGSSALAIVLVTTGAFAVAGGDVHAGLGHDEVATGDGSTTPRPIGVVPIVPVVPEPVDLGPSGPSMGPRPSYGAPRVPPTPGPVAAPVASPDPTATATPVAPSPAAGATPTSRPTPAPSKPPPTPNRPAATPKPTKSPEPATPGTVRFGSSFDSSGEIAVADHEFGEGDPAVWVATFNRAPGVASVRLEIVQVLADGRQFEHWREDIALSDPTSRRLAGETTLSIYVHGGEGSYRLRYFDGDELLAEGAFEMTS